MLVEGGVKRKGGLPFFKTTLEAKPITVNL
jgi:hypothetical protein